MRPPPCYLWLLETFCKVSQQEEEQEEQEEEQQQQHLNL